MVERRYATKYDIFFDIISLILYPAKSFKHQEEDSRRYVHIIWFCNCI